MPGLMNLGKPPVSASSIANQQRYLYDIFSLPCSSETYIPNKRIRNLLAHYNSSLNDDCLNNIESSLRCLNSLHTWSYPAGGSETNIVHRYLESYLNIIHNLSNQQLPLNTSVTTAGLTIPLHLASASKPEPRIELNGHILIASEAKGVESSHYPALTQGFEVGGDGAVYLRRFISLEDSVVPVILSYGTFFQIFAVYLLPENFPVMIELSGPISYLTLSGRLSLARWAVVLNDFYLQTINLLPPVDLKKNKKMSVVKISLSQTLFYKPILNNFNDGDPTIQYGSRLRSSVELLMLAYKRLSVIEEADKFFLFPIGLMSYPADQFSEPFFNDIKSGLYQFFRRFFPRKVSLVASGCPVVVFNLLDSTWKNQKPPPQYSQSYLEGIEKAISMLNSAQIAHLDLRPTNIMWRIIDDTTLEIQVIDFEDSLPFNSFFHPYQAIAYDRRYPFFEQTSPQKITMDHNTWFSVAINHWIRSEVDTFEDFMNDPENYEEVESEWKSYQNH